MSEAAIIVIGNEILSGRTLDRNSNFIAKRCFEIGIKVSTIIVIADIKKEIQKAVIKLAKLYDHVFITGGIGPTHDDVTTEAIASAFKRKLILNKKAKELLEKYYDKRNIELNESRMKMAYLPSNSKLIYNPISAAPGFKIKNVWVMAGVPSIMQEMFTGFIEPQIKKGKKIYTRNIDIFEPEGDIAKKLELLQKKFSKAELGSYPFIRGETVGTNIVIKSRQKVLVNKIYFKIKLMFQ